MILAMRTAQYPISLSMLRLPLFLVLYTGHMQWLTEEGRFGSHLVVGTLYPIRMTRWLIRAGVFSLALMLEFYKLRDGDLHDWGEAISTRVSKEMFLSPDGGPLTRNGDAFFHKPPLYFWLTAFTYNMSGINGWAARLWPAIFG